MASAAVPAVAATILSKRATSVKPEECALMRRAQVCPPPPGLWTAGFRPPPGLEPPLALDQPWFVDYVAAAGESDSVSSSSEGPCDPVSPASDASTASGCLLPRVKLSSASPLWVPPAARAPQAPQGTRRGGLPPTAVPLPPGLCLAPPAVAAAVAAAHEAGTCSAVDGPSAPVTPGLQADPSTFTTVTITNLPKNVTRDRLIAFLDKEGFHGFYDFVYLPMKFKHWVPFGNAFVNFVSGGQATRFMEQVNGTTKIEGTETALETAWAEIMQGFSGCVERYRNRQVMHEAVPDMLKPVIFRDGARIPFPEPSVRIKKVPAHSVCAPPGVFVGSGNSGGKGGAAR